MPIRVRCPNGHLLLVKDQYAGRIGVCPRCSAPVAVPAADVDDDQWIATLAAEGPTAGQGEQPLDTTVSSASVILSKNKLCVCCGRVVSQAFAICPQCGTSVSVFRTLEVHLEGEAIVVRLKRARLVDEATIKETAEELCKVVERSSPRDIVLDLEKVERINSAMLGKLVMVQSRMAKEQRLLKLCNIGEEVREVLATTKLEQILCPQSEEADSS